MNRVLIKSSAISFESKTKEYKSEHIKEDKKSSRVRHFLHARILDDIIENKRDRLASFKQGDLFSNILDFVSVIKYYYLFTFHFF